MSLRLPNPMNGLLWGAVLTPGFLLGGRAESVFGLVAVLGSVLAMISLPAPWEAMAPSRRAGALFLVLQLLGLFSYLYSAAFNGLSTGPADWLALPRWTGFGVLAVYLIRHHDGQVRETLERASITLAYAGWLLFLDSELGYAAVLTLCWLLFVSRARRRLLHAAAAAGCVFYSGNRPAWAVGLFVLSAALAVGLGDDLIRRRVPYAARLSFLAFALSMAVTVLLLGSPLARPAPASAPRVASTRAALDHIRRSPVLGWGPARYETASSVENQYLAWALRGGGLAAAVLLFGLSAVATTLLNDANSDLRRLPGVAVFLASVGLLLGAGPFLESWRLFLLTGFYALAIHEAQR